MDLSNLPKHLYLVVSSVQNHVQAPMPLVATSMLATLSASMQDFVRVKQPIGIETPTALYLMAIADSGERKSTVDKLFSKPIHDFEQLMLEHDKQLLKAYKNEHELWKIRCKEAKRQFMNATKRQTNNQEELATVYQGFIDSEPVPPLANKVIYSDATIESLLFELSKNRMGGFFISTEAGNILSRLNTNFTSSLNGLWDGNPISIDRKSSPSFVIKNKPLTCSFMLQPSVLDQIMRTKEDISRGSGLLARFLICKPDSTQGTRFIQPNFHNFHLEDFQSRITELLELSCQFKASNRIEVLSFDHQASHRWVECANKIESLISFNGGLDDIKDSASKVMNNISRVAALFHYYEYGYQNGLESSNKLIGLESLEAAIQLVQYYTYQFKMLFGEKTIQQESWEIGVQLHNYLVRNFTGTSLNITKDWLYKNGPKKIRPKDKLNMALDTLMFNGYLVQLTGFKSATYAVTRKFLFENNLQYFGYEYIQ